MSSHTIADSVLCACHTGPLPVHGFVSGHPPSGVSLLVLADVVVVVVVDDVDLLFFGDTVVVAA